MFAKRDVEHVSVANSLMVAASLEGLSPRYWHQWQEFPRGRSKETCQQEKKRVRIVAFDFAEIPVTVLPKRDIL
jgi:hypothetical protein